MQRDILLAQDREVERINLRNSILLARMTGLEESRDLPSLDSSQDLQSENRAAALFTVAPGLLLVVEGGHWNNALAHRIVQHGISSKALGPFGEFVGLNKAELADFLELDRGTLHRRSQSDQPLPVHSAECVLRLFELDRMVKDTFATVEDAAGWMRKAHPMLDGESPLEAAKTSFGAERVKEILTALKWGGVA